MKVIKRDGREAPFDNTIIRKAIEAANAEVAEADRLSEAMVGFIVGRIAVPLSVAVGLEGSSPGAVFIKHPMQISTDAMMNIMKIVMNWLFFIEFTSFQVANTHLFYHIPGPLSTV